MNKNVSQKKRDLLIELMQGTKENPNLKYTREKLLGIATASELAEILGITRQTMSRLESCTTKLSAAQYLAICAIIEKKKNELLDNIKNDRNKGKSIIELTNMSFYFEVTFAGALHQYDVLNAYMTSENMTELEERLDKISFKEENLAQLRRSTCLDKWLATFNINEVIYPEELFSKGYNVLILDNFKNKNTIKSIVATMKNFVKYNKDNSNSYLYMHYKGVMSLFKGTIPLLEKNIKNANDFLEFVTSFLLLYKNKKILFFDDNFYIRDLSIPTMAIIQNEEIAKEVYKFNENIIRYMMTSRYSDDSTIGLIKTLVNIASNEEYIFYEDNLFKRWNFDDNDISKELKEELDKTSCDELVKDYILELRNQSLLKLNTEGKDIKDNNVLDNELENILSKIISYLNPNYHDSEK